MKGWNILLTITGELHAYDVSESRGDGVAIAGSMTLEDDSASYNTNEPKSPPRMMRFGQKYLDIMRFLPTIPCYDSPHTRECFPSQLFILRTWKSALS